MGCGWEAAEWPVGLPEEVVEGMVAGTSVGMVGGDMTSWLGVAMGCSVGGLGIGAAGWSAARCEAIQYQLRAATRLMTAVAASQV